MGGSGTGKSGISNEDASEAAEEVVSGREDRNEAGESISSLECGTP